MRFFADSGSFLLLFKCKGWNLEWDILKICLGIITFLFQRVFNYSTYLKTRIYLFRLFRHVFFKYDFKEKYDVQLYSISAVLFYIYIYYR